MLIFDNTKFGFVNYMEVIRRIRHNFAADGITNVVEYRETVRGKDNRTLIKFAGWLKEEFKPVATILGLGDMGTGPATATIALEELGVPSVYITAPPGSDLVRAASFADRHPMPVTREPGDVEIVVAGGGGGHSSVILHWALHSEAIVLPVLLPDGSKPKGIEDFKV